MPKNSFIICGLACVAGIFGAFFRWLQNMTAFEPETGLAIPRSMWSIVLLVYLVVMAAALFLAVRWLKNNKRLNHADKFPDAFLGGPLFCKSAAFISVVLIAAGGLMMVYETAYGVFSAFDLICGGFALIGAVSLYTVLTNVNAKDQSSSGLAFILVDLYLCIRLIADYRASASDPVVWHFAIKILAVCAMIMAFYYLSGYCFEKAKPFRTIYFSLLSTVLGITSFSDGNFGSYSLITAGFLVGQLTLTVLLIGNMVHASHDPSPE